MIKSKEDITRTNRDINVIFYTSTGIESVYFTSICH